MLYILISFSTVGAVVYVIRSIIAKISHKKRYARQLIKQAMIFAIILFVAFLGLRIIDSLKYEETLQTEEYQSVHLIEDKIYYKNSKGINMKKNLNDAKIEIIEDSGDLVRMFEYTTYTRNKMSDEWRLILIFNPFDEKERNYKVYVPEGYLNKTQ